MIAVQLIDNTGRVLGNMRLPGGVRLADLERLALAVGHQRQPGHTEGRIAVQPHGHTMEVEVLA